MNLLQLHSKKVAAYKMRILLAHGFIPFTFFVYLERHHQSWSVDEYNESEVFIHEDTNVLYFVFTNGQLRHSVHRAHTHTHTEYSVLLF